MVNNPELDEHWAEFLDRLAHDLNEPLRSINVFSQLLEDMAKRQLGAEGDEVLREVFAGTARMRVLLEGLTGYARALHESSVSASSISNSASLQAAFRIVVAKLDDQIRACEATVDGTGLSGVPKVNVSLERLMQLIENLIGNSLRFRSERPPSIQLTAATADDGMVAVSVEDNGIGIAPGDCEAIFKPFMRVEGKKYPGAGLGLSTCRKIVEAHGGTIRMESTPGRGSVCTLTLPEA